MNRTKLIDLSIKDLAENSICEMVEDPLHQDVVGERVQSIPGEARTNRLADTQVQLADGSLHWALLGNISPQNAKSTRHFMTLSIHHQGKWFDLARYHDAH